MTIELVIHGKVQGVGYRYFVRQCCRDLGITGWVMNRKDGCVVLQATGTAASIGTLKQKCLIGPTGSIVEKIEDRVINEERFDGFEIRR